MTVCMNFRDDKDFNFIKTSRSILQFSNMSDDDDYHARIRWLECGCTDCKLSFKKI